MQYPPVHVRSTQQSMHIIKTMSTTMTALVSTVGGIHMVIRQVFTQKTIFTVTGYNFNRLTLTLDQSSTVPVTIMCGLLRQGVVSCCLYSQQESP